MLIHQLINFSNKFDDEDRWQGQQVGEVERDENREDERDVR
jgi:hypothetical protein